MLFLMKKKNKKGVEEKPVALIKSNCFPPEKLEYKTKRASSAISFCKVKGGLTLEAALTLPLFIAATFVIIFFIRVVMLQVRLENALLNQVMSLSGKGYFLSVKEELSDTLNYFSSTYVCKKVISEIGKDYLDKSLIINGSKGLNIDYFNINGDGIIDVELFYKMKVPFNIFRIPPVRMTSRARCRSWIGQSLSEAKENKQEVYITKNGEVYHTDNNCTYIKKELDNCSFADIENARNSSGAKYYACNMCAHGDPPEYVYFTKYGTRYHYSISCKNLNTNVFTMTLSNARKQYRACSKCARKGEKDG